MHTCQLLQHSGHCPSWAKISVTVHLRTVPSNKEVFFCGWVYDYAGKADLLKAIEIQKEN